MESKKKLKNTYIKTTLQNLWDETKTVLRGKSIAIDAFLKKQKNVSNKYPNLSPIEKQRYYFTNKGQSSQSYGFSSSHVWM